MSEKKCTGRPGCMGKVRAKGLCHSCYMRQRRRGTTEYKQRPGRTVEERFFDHVDKNGPIPADHPELGPCWVWTGSTSKGTPMFWDGTQEGRGMSAARWAYKTFIGDPGEHVVSSRCENTFCVNYTSHLKTRPKNAPDVSRQIAQVAKLTEDQVRLIRSDLDAGGSLKDLSREFGVKVRTIREIRDRKTWRHI